VQKNTDINIDSSSLENQCLYLCFFMGRSPKRRRSAAKTELHGFMQRQQFYRIINKMNRIIPQTRLNNTIYGIILINKCKKEEKERRRFYERKKSHTGHSGD
jgi:hypothetical protein